MVLRLLASWKSIPQFNSHWIWIFDMLGWRQKLLHKFWEVFMNASDGTETINFDSFTKNFGFNKSDYGVENCFRYFNITRNGEIDFLEFMIGAWNMCPENIDTLVRFAFDMYDVDDDFELSIPNIEKIPVSKEIIHDMIAFTEERGGALDLESFAFYCVEHSHILLPIFIIQRKIQSQIFGTNYWRRAQSQLTPKRFFRKKPKSNTAVYPKDIQAKLRRYGSGGAASYAVEFQG